MWWCLTQIKAYWLVQYYRPGEWGCGCLTEARSHGAVVFFFIIIFSSGGHLVQQNRTVWAILVEDHPRNILVKLLKNLSSSVREVLKQKLQCMQVNFLENQPLLWHLKAWWTEEQMDEWINKQTEGTLDWYLTYQILTKSIILFKKISAL